MKPAIYVVVNKGLGMSPGKVAAQVGHAVAGTLLRAQGDTPWLEHPHRWMLVLEAQDATHLWSIRHYLMERAVIPYMVVDEGVNEIPALSSTALAVGPIDKDSPEAAYLSGLKLYKFTPYDLKDVGLQVDDKYLNRKGKKILGSKS